MLALRRAYNRRFPQEENPFYRYVRVPIPLEEDNKPDSAREQEQGEKRPEEDGKAAPTEEIKPDKAVDVKMKVDTPASTSLNTEVTLTAEPLPSTSTDVPAVPIVDPESTAAVAASNGAPSEEKEGDETKLGEGEPTEGVAEVDAMELDYYEDRIDVEWSEVDVETKVRCFGGPSSSRFPSTELTPSSLLSPPRSKPSTTFAIGT